MLRVAGPHEALVKSAIGKEPAICIGGRIFALPCISQVDKLSLQLRTIDVRTEQGITSKGVKLNVSSCCQVKIRAWTPVPHSSDLQVDYGALRLAAQHFLGKSEHEINEAIRHTLEGHQRSIISSLTVEELYSDRAAFTKKVREHAAGDLRGMGLSIVSYTVSDIADEGGYMDAKGTTQVANMRRTADIGQAEQRSKARAFVAKERAAQHVAENAQRERTIDSDRDVIAFRSECQIPVDRALNVQRRMEAISLAEENKELLYKRQKALTDEAVAANLVAKEHVVREKLWSEQRVNVKSDAELYEARKDAECLRMSARAEADAIRMIAEAEADADLDRKDISTEFLGRQVAILNKCTNDALAISMALDAMPGVMRKTMKNLPAETELTFVVNSEEPGLAPGPATSSSSDVPESSFRRVLHSVLNSRPALFASGTLGYYAWRRMGTSGASS